ncbi:hypothetical protein CSPX01_05758 [Colletotrichum filicis]|nr:hypothetical protein CSPX01_05758 [Colletotrichum filicis]
MKEEIHEAHASILDSISGFMFFGVPHQGLAIESLVPLVKNQPNRSLLESLNKNSALLQRLEKEFNNVISAKRPSIVSFYETEKSPTAIEVNGKWELSGPSEVLVDVSSATCYSSQRHPIDRNHSEMVKYSHGHDVFYRRVITVTREILSTTTQSRIGVRSPETRVDYCLRSLSFREQEYRYSDVYSPKDTCGWLLEDPQYQAWMNSARGLFWIKGNPGTGKSVLMKFAVTTMDRRGSGELVVSFFIHGRGNPLQKTPLGVFRALLNSMLKFFPQHLSQLTERFKDRQARFGTYEENRWSWAERELQDFMSEILTKGTKKRPVVIFVDALDESGEDDARSLLAYFKTLMNDIEREKAPVKICFSSRHYPILGYETMPAIHVEEKNDEDIRLVVRERLKEIQPAAKRQQLENEVLMKAHGGFQWTILIVALILHGSVIGTRVENLHKRLTAIPEALDGLARVGIPTDKDCTNISQLRRHDNWTDTATQFERIVTHISKGLVEFRTREIWEQHDPDGEDWDREAQFIHQSVADYVLGKFIKPNPQNSSFQSPIGASHFEISRSCLSYLTLREVLEGAELSLGKLSARFPLIPYTAQFLFHHIQEVERAGIPQDDLLTCIYWYRQSEILHKIASLWRVMDPDNIHAPRGWPFVGATPLHVLVGFGSKSCLDSLLIKDHAELEGRDADGNTPLLLALRENREDMALLLLDRSIDWQLQEGAVNLKVAQDDSQGQTRNYLSHLNMENGDGEVPLTVAVTMGAWQVIFKLIKGGADLELFGHQKELVSYAIRHRDKRLISMLLEKGVELDGAIFCLVKGMSENCDLDGLEILSKLLKAGGNTRRSKGFDLNEDGDEDGYEDGYGYEFDDNEAMNLASRRCYTAVVSLLLSHGVSADRQDILGDFPLLIAARNGDTETVKILRHHAPQMVGVFGAWKETAFDVAVGEGHFELAIRFLRQGNQDFESDASFWTAVEANKLRLAKAILHVRLENGDAGNERDPDGRTPFLWAIQMGHEAIVKMFLDTGKVNVDERDKDGRTLFLWALQLGWRAVAKVLLDTGKFDVDERDQHGQTPLLWAIQHGHEATIEFLVFVGNADVNRTDEHGRTPLLWAIQHGKEEMVELLLDTGKADVDKKDHYGQTPLFWASQYGLRWVVKLLVDKSKASVDGKDQCGRTPLLLAAQHGHEAVVKLLLDTGSR